jgi:hypothetical protein
MHDSSQNQIMCRSSYRRYNCGLLQQRSGFGDPWKPLIEARVTRGTRRVAKEWDYSQSKSEGAMAMCYDSREQPDLP